jgi:hypothetical protein
MWRTPAAAITVNCRWSTRFAVDFELASNGANVWRASGPDTSADPDSRATTANAPAGPVAPA